MDSAPENGPHGESDAAVPEQQHAGRRPAHLLLDAGRRPAHLLLDAGRRPAHPGPDDKSAQDPRTTGQHTVSRGLTAVLLAAMFVALFLFEMGETIEEWRVPRRDAEQYALVGWHIAHDFTASLAPEGARPDRPSAHRAPAYPALLAAVILASPDLRAVTLGEILNPDSLPKLRPFWIMNTLLLLAAAATAMAIAWHATGSRIASWLALTAVGLDTALIGRTASLLSENLATPLMTAFCLAVALAVKKESHRLFALGGFLLSLLALTRPAFFYLWVPTVILILSLPRWAGFDRKRARRAALVFMLAFAPLVLGWMARNAWQFDRFFLAEGSGVNLDIRSRLDMMSFRQGVASFVLWARTPLARRNAPGWQAWLGEEETAFLEGTDERHYHMQAVVRRNELRDEHGGVEADRLQKKEAMRRILSHPLRHALATIPIAHRGIYQHDLMLSFLLYASLIGAFVLAVYRRDPLQVTLFFPAAFTVVFHSVLTENITRYNEPIVPLLWCALIVCAFRMIAREARASA